MEIPNRTAKDLDKFDRERNTFKRAVKDKDVDRIDLEIGDSKQDDFKPQAKIKRWDNEVNFSLRRKKKWDNPKVKTESNDGGKVKFQDKQEEVHLYEKPDIAEDGGLELELLLKDQPDSNSFEFSIRTKGLDFFYQPELTEEEKENGARRPDNVVGSYAVYHKDKKDNRVGGKNYKTGKAFHIYRPHVTDAEGNEVWGEIDIDEESKELTVTVPQEFLDKAVYPVVVDPTFGYNTMGASETIIGGGSRGVPWYYPSGTSYQLYKDAGVTKVTVGISTYAIIQTYPLKFGVYKEDGNGADSHTLKASNSESKNFVESATWYEIASNTSLTADDYILVALADGDGTDGEFYLRYDSSGSRRHYITTDDTETYTLADPWSKTESGTGKKHSIYATYTIISYPAQGASSAGGVGSVKF